MCARVPLLLSTSLVATNSNVFLEINMLVCARRFSRIAYPAPNFLAYHFSPHALMKGRDVMCKKSVVVGGGGAGFADLEKLWKNCNLFLRDFFVQRGFRGWGAFVDLWFGLHFM